MSSDVLADTAVVIFRVYVFGRARILAVVDK
jgi:hypothetical protein